MNQNVLVNVTARQAHELHDQVYAALLDSEPEILDGLKPVAVTDRGNIGKIKWPTSSQMSLALSRAMLFVKTTKDGESPCAPPSAVVRSVLEQWKVDNQEAAGQAIYQFYAGGSR